MQGGLYNSLIRALQQFGLADAFGECEIPILVLNVTFPLVPEEIVDILRRQACGADRRGRAAGIHRTGNSGHVLRRLDINTPIHGKDMLMAAGEYTVEVMAGGLEKFVDRYLPRHRSTPR